MLSRHFSVLDHTNRIRWFMLVYGTYFAKGSWDHYWNLVKVFLVVIMLQRWSNMSHGSLSGILVNHEMAHIKPQTTIWFIIDRSYNSPPIQPQATIQNNTGISWMISKSIFGGKLFIRNAIVMFICRVLLKLYKKMHYCDTVWFIMLFHGGRVEVVSKHHFTEFHITPGMHAIVVMGKSWISSATKR